MRIKLQIEETLAKESFVWVLEKSGDRKSHLGG